MTNEPAVLGQQVPTTKTTDSHDYIFRLVREGVCRVSQGDRIVACSVHKQSSNNHKTLRLKSPVSWDTAGDDKLVDRRPYIHVRGSAQQSERSWLHCRNPSSITGTLSAFLSPPLLSGVMGMEAFVANCQLVT